MLSSNKLLRRYTPPTCTLEIWGNRSPLSVWAGRDLLKDVHFKLHFDDPKIASHEQVTVKGDRTQLQLLCEVVSSYVQNLLVTSPTAFPLTSTATLAKPSTSLLPSLQPQGLLTHELSFGTITPEASQPSVQLTASQLFDLANALEEYNSEAELLPRLNQAQSRKAALAWTSVAAATVLAVGLTATGIGIYRSNQQIASNRPQTQPSPSPLADSIPPVPPPPTGKSVPSPNTPTTLSETKTLPTPSQVQTVPVPSRNPSIPVVVPPQPVLPPPPSVPSAPAKTSIVITPQENRLPAPSTAIKPNAPASVSSEAFNPTPASPNIPKLPSLDSTPSEQVMARRDAEKPNNSSTLLDTIPQVTEAREYFKQRWQPPESLKQTLEYRLVLNQDGSIKQIVPLGQAAKVYIDRTNMPLLNEPFVSPLEIAGNPNLRLVLSPDGTVRTFLEQ